ncbi:hypothetical protein ACLOJK_035156 [Asimina triloba]
MTDRDLLGLDLGPEHRNESGSVMLLIVVGSGGVCCRGHCLCYCSANAASVGAAMERTALPWCDRCGRPVAGDGWIWIKGYGDGRSPAAHAYDTARCRSWMPLAARPMTPLAAVHGRCLLLGLFGMKTLPPFVWMGPIGRSADRTLAGVGLDDSPLEKMEHQILVLRRCTNNCIHGLY